MFLPTIFQLQRDKDMDPGRQRAHAAGPRAAHAGGGTGGHPVAGDDQPHLGGEDASVPAVQRGGGRGGAQAVQGHGRRAHQDLQD